MRFSLKWSLWKKIINQLAINYKVAKNSTFMLSEINLSYNLKLENMKTLKFKKESGIWYIVLRYWMGSQANLAMVQGADTLLDIMSNGKNEVTVKVGTTKSTQTPKYTLERVNYQGGGALYNLHSEKYNFTVWLCAVTRFVYGYMPKEFYCY